jgi:hypothetical protein
MKCIAAADYSMVIIYYYSFKCYAGQQATDGRRCRQLVGFASRSRLEYDDVCFPPAASCQPSRSIAATHFISSFLVHQNHTFSINIFYFIADH